MNEILEYQGIWWLPGDPDNQVPGLFKFIPNEGITLELQGKLHFLDSTRRSFPPSLIIGIAGSGEYLTLLNCTLTKTKIAISSGYDRSSLVAEMAFRGKGFDRLHFNDLETIKFQGLSIHYSHLDEWFAEYGADFEIEDSDFPKTKPLIVRYKPSQAIEAKLDGYRIRFVSRYKYSHSIRKRITINQQSFIEIIFDHEAKSLEDCFYAIYQVQNFLTLGMSVPTYPLQIIGITESDTNIDILYSQSNLPKIISPLDHRQMLFTFPVIQDNFETYLTNWLTKAESLEPVYDLYFATRHNPHQYLQSTFLNLTQALETYHRRQFGGAYQQNSEYREGLYKRFVEAIPPDLDSDFKQSLKSGSLQYANQYSLRKRLKELTEKISDEGFDIRFIRSKSSRTEFAGKVSETRNFLTHYDPEKPMIISTKELLDLTEKLLVLIEVYLLKEIGFDSLTIRKLTSGHWKYKPVFRRW